MSLKALVRSEVCHAATSGLGHGQRGARGIFLSRGAACAVCFHSSHFSHSSFSSPAKSRETRNPRLRKWDYAGISKLKLFGRGKFSSLRLSSLASQAGLSDESLGFAGCGQPFRQLGAQAQLLLPRCFRQTLRQQPVRILVQATRSSGQVPPPVCFSLGNWKEALQQQKVQAE